jgi:hypothetical protein
MKQTAAKTEAHINYLASLSEETPRPIASPNCQTRSRSPWISRLPALFNSWLPMKSSLLTV